MKELKGKFIVAFDTICDGEQCSTDEQGKPCPELFDSESDAFFEIFCDAIAGIDGNEDAFEDNELDRETVLSEMRELLEEGVYDKMSNYFKVNPKVNYYEEFVVPADEFILGRKAIFTGQGIVIEGVKLENL